MRLLVQSNAAIDYPKFKGGLGRLRPVHTPVLSANF